MDFDVAIVGAGPAGCMAAIKLARYGHSVALFDLCERERLGNTVIVEVERTVFAQLGLAPPTADELPYHTTNVRVLSPRRRVAFSIAGGLPTAAVYLDRFSKALLELAERAGAHFYGGYRARRALDRAGRVQGVVFDHRDGEHLVTARLVIDASGFAAVLGRSIEQLEQRQHFVDSADEVLAGNYLHGIDLPSAHAAVAAGVHGDDELRAGVGQFGRYSTEFSYLSLAAQKAYVLIGIKADYDGPPLAQLVEQFKITQGYYGECLYGGVGKIRIRHSLERLVADGFMAIGEAACMVNPLLGSGVATALLAGAAAADQASPALYAGHPTTDALWPFAAAYQRGRGAVYASYAVVRLFTEALRYDQAITMVEGGISRPADVVATNCGRPIFSPSWSTLRRGVTMLQHADLAWPLAKMTARHAAVYQHYRRYPRRYDPDGFAAWQKWSLRLFGPGR